jgi:phosphate-selective porin OprO/OprP
VTNKPFFRSALIAAVFVCTPAQADDDYPTVDFGGRLQLDYTWFDDDKSDLDTGGEVRRARLFAKGKLAKDWDYKLQLDFSGDDPELKDGFLRYSGVDNSRIWLGNFKQPSSLEQLTSSKYITFTERAFTSGLSEGRRMGLGYQGWSQHSTWFLSLYGDEANQNVEGNGIGGRYVYRPFQQEKSVLHLAINASWNEDEDDTIRLRARPESHQDSSRIIDTGSIANVEDFTTLGLETALVSGRFSAQGEFKSLSLNRRGAEDLSFSGVYVYASCFLTNDSRPYSGKDGAFGRVKPSGDKGAWELALRYSHLDLSDEEILGGEADVVTFAVNYYATSHLRFMADFIAADSDEVAGDDDPNALQFRMQYDF